MSPSTKNLRERIEDIIWGDGKPLDDKMRNAFHTQDEQKWDRENIDALTSLLSSELSLAVKGLREAVAGADKDMCVTGTEEGARAASTMNRSMERHLQAFDSKAKEILGESS